MNGKRAYNRRSDDQRIADLEAQIELIRTRTEEKQRPDAAVLKEVPRVSQRLRKFADKCHQFGRADLANSVVAFVAGLERAAESDPTERRGRKSKDE
jgi:molecular chaperone GrpE (heat shock protein)